MKRLKRLKYGIAAECLLLAVLSLCIYEKKQRLFFSDSVKTLGWIREKDEDGNEEEKEDQKKDYIKWVEFRVPEKLLSAAYELDVQSYDSKIHLNWIELLAYLAAKHGGDFTDQRLEMELKQLSETLLKKESTMVELTRDMKYFPYYKEAYEAVLGGFVGSYEIQKRQEDGSLVWEKCYGLKAFSPIAKGFYYEDYDDFGVSRSYGYARPHLGHDMMGQIGTPIIAVESGYVEALGWNQYGGWRIGIRSFDKKRYYYYAHLRQNFPYAENLKEGSRVTAGDVIGYMGHTGYSRQENVNNIKVTHLHWGLQLIFDESQKEGNNEIWVDCYQLSKFLYRNRSETKKEENTKEWKRVLAMKDPETEQFQKTRFAAEDINE